MSVETLAKYGISLASLDAHALIKLRNIYESETKALKGKKDEQEQVTGGWLTALGAAVETNEDVLAKIKTFKSEVRAMFYALIDEDTDVLIPLVEALQTLKQDVMNERDHYVDKIKREHSGARVTDADFDAKLQEVEDLAKSIRLFYQALAPMLTFTMTEQDEDGEDVIVPDVEAQAAFDREFPTEDKIVGGKPSGEKLPTLSRLPQKSSGESSGRNASQRHLQLTWNGENLPVGTLVSDAAHDYVSDIKTGYVVTGPDINKALKTLGVEMLSATPWTLEFETGTLTGVDVREVKEHAARAESASGVVLTEEQAAEVSDSQSESE